MKPTSSIWALILKRGDLVFGLALLSVVVVLIVPFSPPMLDVMLSTSIMLSIFIILRVSYLRTPTEFYVFPTVLLFVTLFRLGLNVATTRAILSNADAGQLVYAFGDFVAGGNLVVGLIVFMILTVINFMVITKGAGRVAEVSARFTLDAMPGRQMSIDADLNAGIISEKDARDRRKQIQKDADFYGSMDGASKFVQGDAIAGIIITVINLIGGFAVGMLQKNFTAEESIHTYSLLTVGDGLIAQIPALLISTAAGLLVTRSSHGAGLGEDFTRQLFGSRRTMMIVSIVLLGMACVPGFPWQVMLFLSIGLFLVSRLIPPDLEYVPVGEAEGTAGGKAPDGTPGVNMPGREQRPEAVLKLDPLALEIGLDLLPLVHGNMKNMLDRIAVLRRSLSQEFGVLIPSINVRDNPGLPPHEYAFLIRNHEVARAELFPGQLMAMGMDSLSKPLLRGRATKEPAFGLPAMWINETDRREAERLGYAVVDPLSVLITHVSETLRSSASDIFNRQDAQNLLDTLKDSHAAVLNEMKNLGLNIGTVHRVLQNLLKEGVSIRELGVILEKLCDQFAFTKNPDELSEACRKVLVLEICRHCEVTNNKFVCITLHPELEQIISKGVRQTPQEVSLVMDPHTARHVHDHLARGIQEMTKLGRNPLLLCSPMIRLGLKRFYAESFLLLRVIAYNEISPKYKLEPTYTIPSMNVPAAA